MTFDVGIVGVGLIGASIGLRARQTGARVVGFDAAESHRDHALACGALEEALESERAVADACDTLVIATPIDETLRLLRSFAAAPPRASLLLDVASVKACVMEAAVGLASFAGTHPIAGSEQSGPRAARPELFAGRTWAYIPGPLDGRVIAFIESMGARPVAVQADEHDRIVAATSHLPQLLSVALAAYLGTLLEDERACALSGTGLRSMTRLGASSWNVWQGILRYNGANVSKEVRKLAEILGSITEEVAQCDCESLAKRFNASAVAVARLHGTDSARAL